MDVCRVDEYIASSYDAVMESPIYALERKVLPRGGDKMSSSINSTLDDTTPSDSGIQMLDSDCSELMAASITSQNALELDDSKVTESVVCMGNDASRIEASPMPAPDVALVQAQCAIDANSNVTADIPTMDDIMNASNCSTFDTTENIVYRRKVNKTQQSATKTIPKKRVSFHEDILKNTRTDNIHIEHGFITYNGRKMLQKSKALSGRYSWCSEGDRKAATINDDDNTALSLNQSDASQNDLHHRRVVYRNACSDVLDYGNSDAFETNENINCLKYDNTGVFEYDGQTLGAADRRANVASNAAQDNVLYKCSSSSSNSSLDSDENDKNCNRQYGKAKSSSCDYIGMNQINNNMVIGDNCYFSEPNMDNINDVHKKSVWNKEKKPKSSCLKKTKRHTNIIHEQDLNTKIKNFNVHRMNKLFDNGSKTIFGSLKSIFTMPLPERGVPEGSEDLPAVAECVSELEQITSTNKRKFQATTTPTTSLISPTIIKPKPFLSKSLDGSNNNQQHVANKFVHNVDEQLRRKNEEELYTKAIHPNSGQSEASQEPEIKGQPIENKVSSNTKQQQQTQQQQQQQQYRNKFIINCESTVFEHTGVTFDSNNPFLNFSSDNDDNQVNVASLMEKETPIAEPETDSLRVTFTAIPIRKTFSNFFRSFKESPKTAAIKKNTTNRSDPEHAVGLSSKDLEQMNVLKENSATEKYFALKMNKDTIAAAAETLPNSTLKNISTTQSSSTISELASNSTSSIPQKSGASCVNILTHSEKQSRHLPSPLKKRLQTCGNNNVLPVASIVPARSNEHSSNCSRLSPDLFNGYANSVRGGSGRDSKSTIMSEELDDLLTITTDVDKNDSDIVMLDYPEFSDRRSSSTDYPNLLKPPQMKTSLINRFLRNVTQKKILETSIRHNNFFVNKLKTENKLFANSLYLRGAKPTNFELIDDLNAEIAMEIEMSAANSPRKELANIVSDPRNDLSRFELGVGEISIEIFSGNSLYIFQDSTEQLMKVFKLYTGYSREGFMTPVLVFLTDKALYVTDLVRNRLCSKFMLAYSELDVILMGPFGNTVLLSNSMRDMQQVLLAGGPYPADGLVANLELCARRSGSVLPAVGQLTMDHLAPLRAFVRKNSSVTKDDKWMYYAVVNVPTSGAIGSEQEPLGPHIKGFLMYRRLTGNAGSSNNNNNNNNNSNSKNITWSPGYFLLKAGVLYMFNDSTQRLPSWAMALAECQGTRRVLKSGRPHCFEILLKGSLLQLAAPDEYVASEWLQALLQGASGLFEMQEKHKTLGRTLVVTEHHLITLREDFTAPLRRVNKCSDNVTDWCKQNDGSVTEEIRRRDLSNDDNDDNDSLVVGSCSNTPRQENDGFGVTSLHLCSSLNSTPTKFSQLSSSIATFNEAATNASIAVSNRSCPAQSSTCKTIVSGMSSFYGNNSGLEILTCADIKEMTGIKVPSHNDVWWCILEFSCQEVRECSDDLVILFASNSEMQRFLRLLEQLWQEKNNDLFPITVLDEDDAVAEQCTILYMDINRSWEPLLSAALGYPL